MSEPREYTQEEARDLLLDKIVQLCAYWASPEVTRTSIEGRLQGLAFSILATLDGEDGELPRFEVVCSPHPDDKEQGDNWWPAPFVTEDGKSVCYDGATLEWLHEHFHTAVKRAKFGKPTEPPSAPPVPSA